MLIDVKWILISTLITSKGSILLIFIVITSFKCGPRSNQRRLIFLLINFTWIIVLIPIRKSYESPLFLNEFIKMGHFCFFLNTTKRLHSQIEGVHSSRHCTNEFWLVFINKTINFVSVFFNFFSFLNHFGIWLLLVVTSLTTATSLILSILSMISFFSSIVDSLLVVETLNIITVRDSLGKGFSVVGFQRGFLFGGLF